MIKVNFVGKAASVATVEVVIDQESAKQEIEAAIARIGKRVTDSRLQAGQGSKGNG